MARRVFVKLKGLGSIPRLGVFIFSNKFAADPMHNIPNAYHAPSDLSQWIIRETDPTPLEHASPSWTLRGSSHWIHTVSGPA